MEQVSFLGEQRRLQYSSGGEKEFADSNQAGAGHGRRQLGWSKWRPVELAQQHGARSSSATQHGTSARCHNSPLSLTCVTTSGSPVLVNCETRRLISSSGSMPCKQ